MSGHDWPLNIFGQHERRLQNDIAHEKTSSRRMYNIITPVSYTSGLDIAPRDVYDTGAINRPIVVLTNLWFFDHLEAALKNENVLLVIGTEAVAAALWVAM
jgi:hypothetical protein